SEAEHFELEIDRETLGDVSPERPDDQVVGGLALAEDALKIIERDVFDIPVLPGFRTGGLPGAPGLPEQAQYVALPLGGDILALDVIPGNAVKLSGPLNLLPAQEPLPDVGTDPKQFGDGFSIENVQATFTAADPRFFETKTPYPETLVELDGAEEIGPIQMAAVRLRPLQYDPETKSLIYYPNLKYNVRFDLDKAKNLAAERDRKQARVGQYYAEQVNELLARDLVVSAKVLFWPGLLFPEEVPHVIITDNYSWPEAVERNDGTTRAPNLSERGSALAGDPVAEFERLAQWKTARGMRSRVVTISDIVDGAFGDFTEDGFARDLQEVLRNFAKHIHAKWDTLYLLLGGDLNVVPMRRLVGASTYKTIGCGRQAINPPPQNTCHFLAGKAAVKLYPLFTPQSSDPLSSLHGGLRIPFERQAGSGRLGWYYTNEADFTTKDVGFSRLASGQTSRFIIVEGPESVIDDNYYWVRSVNSIPSDFYYASLVGPGYSIAGKHDLIFTPMYGSAGLPWKAAIRLSDL
ncbi:MAG: C25 family cysteine peptidase, partial [Planctomycetota bacterium]